MYTTHRWKLRIFKRLAVGAVGNRTCRERTSRPGDPGISIALVIHSLDPTKDAVSNSIEYNNYAKALLLQRGKMPRLRDWGCPAYGIGVVPPTGLGLSRLRDWSFSCENEL